MWLRPAAEPGLRRLVDAVHREGALVAGQIGHAGPVANAKSNAVRALSPGRMFSPLSLRFSHAISAAEIARRWVKRRQMLGTRPPARVGEA